jgi:two-component sensor histidine kinase
MRDRIAALARTQGLLAGGRASGTDLRALLEAELAPYAGQPDGGRTRLVGAPLDLPARPAQALTLALHELATNAAKYGALSAPTGTVEVMWWKERDRLTLRWLERGGPRLAGEPAAGGFGSRLLDAVIRRQLGGNLSFDWSAEGLCCEFSMDTGPPPSPGDGKAKTGPARRGATLPHEVPASAR